MAHLGHMYANGNGVAQSNVTALRWFKEAAEQVPCCSRGVARAWLDRAAAPPHPSLRWQWLSKVTVHKRSRSVRS